MPGFLKDTRKFKRYNLADVQTSERANTVRDVESPAHSCTQALSATRVVLLTPPRVQAAAFSFLNRNKKNKSAIWKNSLPV